MGTLDGVRVIDLTTGMAGSLATMLLAEVGADVVLVEGTEPGPEREAASFRTWNRSKRSVALDLESLAGRDHLGQLLGAADVLVHELVPSRAAALGLDDASLAATHPGLIVSSVLAWPANRPRAEMAVDETLAMASLGILDEQLPWGRTGPVYLRAPVGSIGAIYTAATGIVARLLVRGRTGQVGPAHTSLVQGAMVPMGMHWSRAEAPSEALATGMPKLGRGSQATIYECGDGQWMHVMGDPMKAPRVAAHVEAQGEQAPRTHRIVDWDAPPSHVRDAFLTDDRQAWLEELWAHDVPVQACADFGDVFQDEQARTNGYVVDLDDPEVGRVTMAGTPLTLDPPQQVKGPAPAHGAHTDAVFGEWRPRPASEAAAPADPVTAPLEGVKVLDFGNFLAGPYAPQMFADLGATVVKIEAVTGDPMRWGDWPFAGCQRGKRGVALDLKSPDAASALAAALRWADVVHHNLRMPAARRLGLDYEAVRAVNPDVVFCHTSSYGPVGARADWPGYDQLFQAQCGWEVLGAGEGNPPMWHRFGFMDHQCAMSSALATLLALHERDRTGRGQAVAGSLLGAGVLTASETYLRPDGTLAPHDLLDAGQTGVSAGRRLIEASDGWVALAAPPGPVPEGLEGLDGSAGSVEDLLRCCAELGIPAVPVAMDQRETFFDDEANRATGLVARYRHRDWGQLEQPGALWYFGDLDVRLELAPPVLGEHTVECLREFGLEADVVDSLLATGAVRQWSGDET